MRSSSTLCSLAPTSGTAGSRLRSHSPYNHYVYLADGWLHGRLALPGPPPNENDWAKIDVLKLRDGRELRGIYGSRTGGPIDRFYPAARHTRDGARRHIESRSTIRYVSFPPFPAVLMAPFVAIWGMSFNDVIWNALWAGPQSDAAVPAAAPPARARPVAPLARSTTCG